MVLPDERGDVFGALPGLRVLHLHRLSEPLEERVAAIADHRGGELDGVVLEQAVGSFEHSLPDAPLAFKRGDDVVRPAADLHAARVGREVQLHPALACGDLAADVDVVLVMEPVGRLLRFRNRQLEAEPQHALALHVVARRPPHARDLLDAELDDVRRHGAGPLVLRPEGRDDLRGEPDAVCEAVRLVDERRHRLALVEHVEPLALGAKRERGVVALPVVEADDEFRLLLPHQAERAVANVVPVRIEDHAEPASQPPETR